MKKNDERFDKLVNSDRQTVADSALMAAAKKIIEQQQRTIERLTSPGFVGPKVKPTVRADGGVSRFVIADVHGSHMDKTAVAALLADMRVVKPKQVVILGDLSDCGGFLAEHHTIGYVAETQYAYEDDIAACNWLLDEIQKLGAEIHYVMGNHERRVERWCITTALKSRSDRGLILKSLLKTLAVENMLQLDKRGVRYVKQGETAEGMFVPATIRLGKSLYTHTGFEKAGERSALQHLQKFSDNVAFGHTHKKTMRCTRIGNTNDTIIGRNPGCLCMPQPLWMHSEPADWTQGYDLEFVRPDGTFLAIGVPIVNGESMLGDMIGKVL